MPSTFDAAAIDRSIPERFEEQVRVGGGQLAIQWADGRYSYAELNAAANRLAHAIRAQRQEHTEPIALLFDHGGDVVAAMLGVLKAGGCYVVLDPTYPHERLAYMLQDSGAALVVSDRGNVERATVLAASRATVIAFDSADSRHSDANPGVYPSPGALALLIYTSGSTGQPKAVMHSHQNVLVDVRNYARGWSVTSGDRWLLGTSMGFAHAVRSVYGALLTGGGLFPFDPNRGFAALTAWLHTHGITIVRVLPTFFRHFAASLAADVVFPSVRVLSLGGEHMLQADTAAFATHFAPHCVLTHAFGPTECFTVSWALIPHGAPLSAGRLPIGRPLPDKHVTLVDESRTEVADGEVGEIAVTSRYLALGYWRAPERTAAAFIDSGSEPGARTYFTGDLARRDPDGVLWHVGRRDFQVKVRGYRVDVSEIENALRRAAGISDAVVIGHPDSRGEHRLIAYIVPASVQAIDDRAIREALSRSLPDYMLPSTFVAVESLPLTPHGKVDRLRLPPPPASGGAARASQPETPIERALALLCAEVLGLERVDVDDGWLDLGGDSLQAARAEALLATRLGAAVSAGTLLRARSLREAAITLAGRVSDRPPASRE